MGRGSTGLNVGLERCLRLDETPELGSATEFITEVSQTRTENKNQNHNHDNQNQDLELDLCPASKPKPQSEPETGPGPDLDPYADSKLPPAPDPTQGPSHKPNIRPFPDRADRPDTTPWAAPTTRRVQSPTGAACRIRADRNPSGPIPARNGSSCGVFWPRSWRREAVPGRSRQMQRSATISDPL